MVVKDCVCVYVRVCCVYFSDFIWFSVCASIYIYISINIINIAKVYQCVSILFALTVYVCVCITVCVCICIKEKESERVYKFEVPAHGAYDKC